MNILKSLFARTPSEPLPPEIQVGDWIVSKRSADNPWPDDYDQVLEIKNGYVRHQIYNRVHGKLVKFTPAHNQVMDERTMRENYCVGKAPHDFQP